MRRGIFTSVKEFIEGLVSSKRRRIICVAFAVMVVSIVIAVIAIVYSDKSRLDQSSCNLVVEDSKKETLELRTVADYENLSNKLGSNSKSCDSKKKFLGLGSDDTAEYKLTQIQFYHSKSTLDYRLAKFDEAKRDAERALAIDEQLKDSDKKIGNYAEIIQDLKWVRDGEY